MKAIQQNLPPTVKADFIGGHFRSFRKNPTEFLTKLSKLGDVSSFKVGGVQAFLINHPDLIRDLLVTNHAKFIKGRALQRAKGLLGEGLLTSEKEFHLRQRRMIQPAFHRTRPRISAPRFRTCRHRPRSETAGGRGGQTRQMVTGQFTGDSA